MPKPIRWAILIVVLAVAVAFAIANHQAVGVYADPFRSGPPLLRMPLFVAIFLFIIVGVLIGGTASWLGQAKWRRRARDSEREIARLNREIAELRAERTVPALPVTPMDVQPPI